jgi:hypothetical protein
MLGALLHHRYRKIVSSRTNRNEYDFDEYINVYKYQKNIRRLKRRLVRHRWTLITRGAKRLLTKKRVVRKAKERFSLLHRFIKGTIYQQTLQEFADVGAQLKGLLFRIREPIRRLNFMNYKKLPWFKQKLRSLRKHRHFVNTVPQVILLHYYKSTELFSAHVGRELEKVRKKVHWKLIYSIRSLLHIVPLHPKIRRQFYGLRLEIAGRPKGRKRTFVFRIREGSLAPQSYRFRVHFGMGQAFTKIGVIGIRTWISH